MSIPKYIKSIQRGVICCGLLFILLPYCQAAQRMIEETTDEQRVPYFPCGKSLLGTGCMCRHLDEPLTNCNRCVRIDSANICSFASLNSSLSTLPKAARVNPDSLKKELCPILEFIKEAKEKTILPPEVPQKTKHPLFALKTNLLQDVTLMPNVEIEVPIGKRWSVNGEYMFPWWLLKNNRYCLEILSGGLEGRYWLGRSKIRENREVLTGHFVGLYAGGGKYDLQWKENGYQGEFFIAAGISYGWATRIARNLHLEFSLGVGLLRTSYRHYHARDNYHTLLWQENGNYTWFGPTKAKISLVWLLNRKVKKGGGR